MRTIGKPCRADIIRPYGLYLNFLRNLHRESLTFSHRPQRRTFMVPSDEESNNHQRNFSLYPRLPLTRELSSDSETEGETRLDVIIFRCGKHTFLRIKVNCE